MRPIAVPVTRIMAMFLRKLGRASPRSPSATSELTTRKEGDAASKKVKCFSSVVC